MNLSELSEESIQEYQDSLFGETEDERSQIRKLQVEHKIKTTGKELQKAVSLIDELTESFHLDDSGKAFYQYASEQCLDTIETLNRCINNLNTIMFSAGLSNAQYAVQSKEKAFVKISEMEGNILHIELDSLLPKRILGNGKQSYMSRQNERAKYQNAFQSYFHGKRYRVYDERVVICFIHHFRTEHEIRDHDNFEVKLIIDLIANYVLVDDSSKYCAHYSDYVMDDKDYSEIYVVPQSGFLEFLNSRR